MFQFGRIKILKTQALGISLEVLRMAFLQPCPSPLSSSLQTPKLLSLSKTSISNTHTPKTLRLNFPSLTHQPICCSNFSFQSESNSSPSTGVFIKGLPHSTAEGRLKKAFAQFGDVKQGELVHQCFLFLLKMSIHGIVLDSSKGGVFQPR
ncbi:hypothetical protein PTKIN_Ptkin09bG0209600 [Pterospermum kingtungense]